MYTRRNYWEHTNQSRRTFSCTTERGIEVAPRSALTAFTPLANLQFECNFLEINNE